MCVGRLTKEQIKAGYSALQCIAGCIDKAQFGPQLTAACNDFYTRIPHYFGFELHFILAQNICRLHIQNYNFVFGGKLFTDMNDVIITE